MALSVKELKEMIVDLKMDKMRMSIPDGHCPYAYYTSFSKPDGDCKDCVACKRKFFEESRKRIEKYVEEL